MYVTMPDKTAAFEYGFLTSRTSKILSKYINSKDYEPDDESLSILNDANLFIEKVINGERLISGDKAGLSPTYDDLQALNYAIGSLSVLQSLNDNLLTNRDDIKRYFSSLHQIMTDILNKRRKELENPDLARIKSFFSVIADLIVSEVQPDFTPDPVLLP